MSTYLVAFSINDLSNKFQTVSRDLTIRCWARPDVVHECMFANKLASELVPYFETITNVKYPLEVMDFLAVPHAKWKGMENWGLIIFNEKNLLLSSNRSSLAQEQQVATLLAHELAHQWFGNLVTMKWWNLLWLNEGFATHVGSLSIDSIRSEWDFYAEDALENTLQIIHKDSLASTHAVARDISSSEAILDSFDLVTYKKGSIVLRMLNLMLGNEKFSEGLQAYFQKHQFKNTDQSDLWQTFANNSELELPVSLAKIMDSWISQSGYPIVNVMRDYTRGTVTVTQHRFLEEFSTKPVSQDKCWWIPVTFTTASQEDFSLDAPISWLGCNPKSGSTKGLKLDVDIKSDDWIVVNIQLYGLYRVMYDMTNWKLISQTLNSEDYTMIHHLNRAQLLSDVIVLSKKGDVDSQLFFQILEYMKREVAHLPWKVLLKELVVTQRHPESFKDFKVSFCSGLKLKLKNLNIWQIFIHSTAGLFVFTRKLSKTPSIFCRS